MYSRTFGNNAYNGVKKEEIPVQCFNTEILNVDSTTERGAPNMGQNDCTRQLEKEDGMQQCREENFIREENCACEDRFPSEEKPCCKSKPEKKNCVFGNFSIDDIILIALIFLFLKDDMQKDDMIIPLLFAVLLIF